VILLFLHVTTLELPKVSKEFGCKEMVLTITHGNGNSSRLGGTLYPEARVSIVGSQEVRLMSNLQKYFQNLLVISTMEVQVVFMDIRLHLNQRAAHNPSQR
jgi:hypothetical protein